MLENDTILLLTYLKSMHENDTIFLLTYLKVMQLTLVLVVSSVLAPSGGPGGGSYKYRTNDISLCIFRGAYVLIYCGKALAMISKNNLLL